MNTQRLSEVHLTTKFFLVFVGGLGLLAESATAAPKAMATVLGRVLVKRKNLATTTTLQANDKLYPGDVVVTGLSVGATIQFADGSRVDMAGRSTLEITNSAGHGRTLFRALNGRMAAHLRPGKVIATRTSLVRVKGTVILISIDDNGVATLSVLEGAAEFYNPCGSVIVPAGAQSTVLPGNAPTAPTAIPDVQALLRNWEDQTDVLSPFVKPGAQPVPNPIAYGYINGWGPDYLQDAVAHLKARPANERLVFMTALANIKPKLNKDCGCDGTANSK
ncbi:hypothetical protein IAD21_06147 [Abditibacteriota bacterium]|nr:hypothetical protein IAD21_06147 [Abditibacteriota bacterium]